MFYLAVCVLRVRAAPGSSLATFVLSSALMYLWSPLYRTLKVFYSVVLTFRYARLILSFNVICYLHKVKAQCGGSGFTYETASLNLVLFDTGRFTLEKGLIVLFSFVFSRSDVTQIDIMPKSNSLSC